MLRRERRSKGRKREVRGRPEGKEADSSQQHDRMLIYITLCFVSSLFIVARVVFGCLGRSLLAMVLVCAARRSDLVRLTSMNHRRNERQSRQ